MPDSETRSVEVSRHIWTVPNFISFLRIASIPVIAWLIASNHLLWSLLLMALSGISDGVDGYVARRFDQVSVLGQILDPIADKVTLISVAVCMVIYMPAILPIMMVLVTKEFLMLLGGFILLLCKVAPPPANIFGKVATVIFYFVICLIIFIKILTGQENMLLVYIGLILTAMAMIIALIQYGVVFFRLIKAKNDEKK